MYRCFECWWKLLPRFSRLTQLYCHRTRIWMIRTESGNCFNSCSASFSFPNRKLCARIKRDKRNGDLTISIPQTVEEMVFALSAKNFLCLWISSCSCWPCLVAEIVVYFLLLLSNTGAAHSFYWLNRNLKIFFYVTVTHFLLALVISSRF